MKFLFALLLVSSFSHADEGVSFEAAALSCHAGIRTVLADNSMPELDFRKSNEHIFLFYGSYQHARGFFLFQPSGQPVFYSFGDGVKGSGWSSIPLSPQIPGLAPAFLEFSFQNGELIALSESNPDYVRQGEYPPAAGVTPERADYEFALTLSLSRSIALLPQTYLTGATDPDKRYCIPRQRFLTALDRCSALPDLNATVQRVRAELMLASEVDCAKP